MNTNDQRNRTAVDITQASIDQSRLEPAEANSNAMLFDDIRQNLLDTNAGIVDLRQSLRAREAEVLALRGMLQRTVNAITYGGTVQAVTEAAIVLDSTADAAAQAEAAIRAGQRRADAEIAASGGGFIYAQHVIDIPDAHYPNGYNAACKKIAEAILGKSLATAAVMAMEGQEGAATA
jgi:hypothetical protein